MSERGHVPVMLAEVMSMLTPQPGEVALDGTIGLGGHSRCIGFALGTRGHLIGIDRDPEALAKARSALADLSCRVTLWHGNFAAAPALLAKMGVEKVDVAMLDLGVSSLQLDNPRRGFSFNRDGPLDMRMDPTQPLTAAAWLARASEEEMERVFRVYGGERFARRIARRIAEIRCQRTIDTTGRLAAIVRGAKPGRGRIDAATRVFQAIRIVVNNELEELERGLTGLLEILSSGGRLAILAFHSLEDRCVKNAFRRAAITGRVRLLCRKPLRPTAVERSTNPRSRSARLRVCQKL